MAIYCTEAERHNYEEKGYWRSLPDMVPSMTFHTRVLNEGTFEWLDVNTWDLFAGENGSSVSTVSKKLNYLIIGDKPTKKKVDKAIELKVTILNQSQFLKMLNITS